MTPISRSAPGIRFAIPRTNAPEDEAEDDVAEGLLGEDAPAPERPDVALAAARVRPVGDDPKRVEGQMLREREPDREPARPDLAPPEDGVEHEPEDRAVRGMERVPRGLPATAGGDELPEQRDVPVFRTEKPHVERLHESPRRGRSGAGGGGADVSPPGRHAGKPRAPALRWPACPKATRSTGRRGSSRCSSASGSRSPRRIRAAGSPASRSVSTAGGSSRSRRAGKTPGWPS